MIGQQQKGIPAWLQWMLISAMMVTGFVVTTLFYLIVTTSLNIPIRPLDQPLLLEMLIDEIPEPLLEAMAVLEPSDIAVIPTAAPLPQLASNDRINVLVMGVDRRPGEPFSTRTDTMIVLSINPENNTASMLSIPRDLYVDIPGIGNQRINTALPYGAYSGGDAGGAELVRQTINHNLGISIDHYVLLDFQTVIGVIDTAGGVMIDVPYDINDPTYPDMNYGYDPLFVPQGRWLMSGDAALKYMRTRHADGDFNRSKRQQQVILAFRDALLSDGLTGAAVKVRSFYNEARDGIVTDMAITDMLSIANAASRVDIEHIRSAVLDSNYVHDHTTESGAYVLIPHPDAISRLIQELFS